MAQKKTTSAGPVRSSSPNTANQTDPPNRAVFASDRVLLYDLEPWNRLGFGVPNFGDNLGTVSQPIWNLADFIGKAQLFIMTHVDAQRMQAPSRNTVERLGKLINRVNTVLGGRLKEYNELRLEEGHASAVLRAWQIHPVPYFRSPVLRNHWRSEYNELAMIGLTNLFQHSDNRLALTVTKALASDVWRYFREIKILLGSELLLLPGETVEPDEFLFTEEHYAAYDPDLINFEDLDTPGPIQSRATEDDLRPLFNGIPSNVIAPVLAQYPVTEDGLGMSGAPLPENASAVGTADRSAIGPRGRNIGESAT